MANQPQRPQSPLGGRDPLGGRVADRRDEADTNRGPGSRDREQQPASSQTPPEGHDYANPGPGEPGGPSAPSDPSMQTVADEQRERSDRGNPIRDERAPGDRGRQVPGVGFKDQ